MCKIANSIGSVEHYYTSGKSRPSLLDASNPSIGLSNVQVRVDNEMMTCSFSRAIETGSVANYFNTNNPFYLLLAKGYIIPPSNSILYA
jgi:hypothetical protein